MKINELDSKYKRNFLKFTRKAFSLLPSMTNPKILDIGCGTGQSTIELLKLSNGSIIGIDIDKKALDNFNKKIKEQNLLKKVKVMNYNLLNIKFMKESFDIIWAEGVIHIIGFEKSFKVCYELLKNNGFFVLHESIKKLEKNKECIEKNGFKLYDYFALPEGFWWTDYYKPLEEVMKNINEKNLSKEELKKVKHLKKEIKMVKNIDLKEFDCAFYILQKNKNMRSNY
ncbi:MAG: class I SAM-dependent methyltransferase [Candidatus Lokiarchaeota archaeon]|nr:class I SAM-dependent methyltransferase [Candidatus Lokiarchaeota archaeon]